MNRFKNWTIALITSLLLAVGFIYVARGLTNIYEKDDASIRTILADGGLTTLVSFVIVVLLCELSIAITMTHSDIENAKLSKAKALSQISPNLGKGHKFCEKRNEQERKLRKETIIRKYFLDLKDYDEYIKLGGLKNKDLSLWTKISLWRMEKKIKKVAYDTYNFEEIVNGTSKPELRKKKRFTLKGLRTKKYSKKIFTSIATGIIFGYFGLKLAESPNWGMVIYLAIQFVTFIANGMIQFFMTRSDILNDYKDQIKEDTNFLWEFDGSLTLHPEWYIEEQPKPIIETASKKDELSIINENKNNLLKEEDKLQDELNIKGELANE